MATANISVITLAMIMGKSLIARPYTSQSSTPEANILYIPSEILLVSLSRIVFMACGKKENVVKAAASKPINFICFSSKVYLSNHLNDCIFCFYRKFYAFVCRFTRYPLSIYSDFFDGAIMNNKSKSTILMSISFL
jgi:hypothetical protein